MQPTKKDWEEWVKNMLAKNPEFLDGYGWDMNPYEEYTIEYGFGSTSSYIPDVWKELGIGE